MHPSHPDALGAVGVTAAEWDDLALSSHNIFATREWLGTWQRYEPPPNGAVTLVSRRADGALAGLLPLSVHRRFPRVLRSMGPWPPPDGPLICVEEDETWVVRDLAEQLATRGGWDILEMDAVPTDLPWTEILGGVTFERAPSRVIDLRGLTWKELLALASRNSRRDIRRRERRLHERYSVQFRMTDCQSLHADVDLFLRLHWARWDQRVNLLTPDRRSFIHDFAHQAYARGWLALWVMELDGRPVAADLNFRFAGREVALLSGRDPAFRADYVGLALMFHTIRQAADDGVAEFHLLRGGDPFKARLPHRDRPIAHIALSRNLPGMAVIAARSAGREFHRAMRDSALNQWRRRLNAIPVSSE
jgi:CelD/BcsL family acetyltransferase involved in cellulose biosynthesis